MVFRKQPRSIARELALLSVSQMKIKPEKLAREEIDNLVLRAVRTLTAEVQDILESAAAETQRGEERLLSSETRANNLDSSRAMVSDAIKLTQQAINRLGIAAELPEFIQLTNKEQVREYAISIITSVGDRSKEIEEHIEKSLVAWQISRLPKIDRDILRIAVAEMLFLDLPVRVAINEAVELAKRYSDDDGFRFINGVLRKVSDRLQKENLIKQ